MAWQDQGRQEHGWFGNGTGGREDDGDKLFGQSDPGQRIGAVAYGVIGHLPKSSRSHAAAALDSRALGRLRTVMTAGMRPGASAAMIFLDPGTSDKIVDLLRSAAHGAAEAETHQGLKAASADLADAMQRTGLNRWPRFVADATDRAGAAKAGRVEPPGPTAPMPLVDDQGRQVIGGDGTPVLWPAGLDPHFFVQQGRVAGELLRNGSDAAGPAVLGYLAGQLFNFDRGASWDAQRIGGQYHKEYVNYATIAIGLYAAAAGISRVEILEAQDWKAESSHYPPGTVYDAIYTHLPDTNVINTEIGYQLYEFGRIK